MDILSLLKRASELNVSDIHITVGSEVICRINDRFEKLNDTKLTKIDIEKIVIGLIDEEKFIKFKEVGEIDLSIGIDTGERFRINIYKQKSNYAIAIRVIPSKIPKFEQLGLPKAIKELTNKEKGLILITGPTGSGKSTTLASIIDLINENQYKHIITLEDPIEYIHCHKKGLINQREIGSDTESFSSALRSILRQDPDVILIGEMRDLETISIALMAAETGHLVLSTMHTLGTAKTIDRIVSMFHAKQQEQIRTQLSTVCEGIISQQLINTLDNKKIAAVEVMIPNTAIRNLIRENKIYQINTVVQTNSKIGMQSMDQDLIKLYKEKVISKETLLSKCVDFDYISKSIGGSY